MNGPELPFGGLTLMGSFGSNFPSICRSRSNGMNACGFSTPNKE